MIKDFFSTHRDIKLAAMFVAIKLIVLIIALITFHPWLMVIYFPAAIAGWLFLIRDMRNHEAS